MDIPEETKKSIIKAHISAEKRRGAATRWSTISLDERRIHTALPIYARKLKNKGISAAEAWIVGRFGEEQGRELLQSRPFKKQWVKYL